MTFRPPALPPFRCTRIHEARSSTLMLIEPAGPTFVMLRNSSLWTLSSRSSYGSAKSGAFWLSATEKFAEVIPSGPKTRSRTASSQLFEVILSTRYPAVRNIALLYWKSVRKSLLGSRSRSFAIISLREASALYQRRSWRGMPDRCVTRSTGVIRSEATGSFRANSGIQVRTGFCHSSFPSSTSVPMTKVVKAFVQEPMAKTVLPVAGRPFSRSRRP